jgi:phenylalanyl-tRNA synthetase beta chain
LLDFYDLKGVVEEVLAAVGAQGVRMTARSDVPHFHPGVCAAIELADGTRVGEVGEIHPETRRAMDIDVACYGFDLDLAALPPMRPRQMRAIPRYPAIVRDVSFFVREDVTAARVGDLFAAARQPLIETVRVLEEYRESGKVPVGQKGMLWSITYRSLERTLTDAEVDQVHEELVGGLLAELDATRR